MTYTLKHNDRYNSREVYFSEKPDAETRTALKQLKMRWNGKKECWYGFAEEQAIHDAIIGQGAEPFRTGGELSDGYMGAIRWDGINSDKHLYGAELSAEIRKALKLNGIKGVTVSCKTYSGGQSVTAKVKTTETDYISFDQYKDAYRVTTSGWIYQECGKCIHSDAYWGATAEEQQEIRRSAAVHDYRHYTVTGEQDVSHHIDSENMPYTGALRDKLRTIKSIIDSFRYDDSNGMVDYFNTNFYYDIETCPVKV